MLCITNHALPVQLCDHIINLFSFFLSLFPSRLKIEVEQKGN